MFLSLNKWKVSLKKMRPARSGDGWEEHGLTFLETMFFSIKVGLELYRTYKNIVCKGGGAPEKGHTPNPHL